MAAKAYNPFQTEFATEDELLGNPYSGLKRNPSKAYETIVAAVKADPDSWIHKKGDNYVYVILSGTMTGTYTLGPRKKLYSPTFEVALNPDNVNLIGLYCLRYEAIMKRVGGIEDAIDAALEYPDPELEAGEGYHWDWFLQKIEMPEDEYSDRYLQDEDREREKARLAARLRKEMAYKADPAGYEAKFRELRRMENRLNTSPGSVAQTAYIMAQAAGVPTEKVIADLREKPKRHLSLLEAQIPGRLTDRVKYCKAFFQRWSVQDAMNAVVKGVEGGIPTGSQYGYMGEPSAIRAALAGVPSWKQKAMVRADEMARERYPDVSLYQGTNDPFLSAQRERLKKFRDEERKKRTPEAILEFVLRAVELQKKLSQAGMPANEFREILSKRDVPYLAHLSDAAAGIRQGLAVLSETNEGRILIRALNQKDWPTVYRGHDVAVAAAYEARNADETPEGRARAEAHKSLARQFVFPPGVRPLVTKAEYEVEGREMSHCVYSMGYYSKMSSFEFAFAASDGTRATLELGNDGVVRQFFGPHDSTPSAATKKMLDKFLSANSDNIKAMRKGEFPVRPTKANPLERASSDMGFMSIWDKDLEQWGMVLFSKSDFGRYRMSGDKKLLSKSVIGYIAACKYQPDWQKPPLPKSAQVSYALAAPGFGPLLYNVALKSLQKKGYDKLYPDFNLSVNAQRFWSRFPDGFMKVMPAAAFEKTFGVSADDILAGGAPLSTAEKADLLRDAENQFGAVHRAMDAETGVSSVKLARVAANPLAKADENTAAIIYEDKEAPIGSGFYTVLFDRADWEKYKRTGAQKDLERSIIGFLDVGDKKKIRYNDPVQRDAVQVGGAIALPGYGPLLYATALKFLERRKKKKLYPDYNLSAHAVRFWSRFPKGYMEPLTGEEYKSSFGVSPTAVMGYAARLSPTEKELIANTANDLFLDVYNSMNADTGAMQKHLPRDSSAHRAYAPVPMAANPFNHFPRRNRR